MKKTPLHLLFRVAGTALALAGPHTGLGQKSVATIPPDLALQPPSLLPSPWPEHLTTVTRQGVAAIERTARGRLWASWVKNPDGPLSYVVLVTSADDGATWSDSKLVIMPTRFIRTRMPCLWVDPQGRLWFFWGQNAGQNDGRWGVWAIVTDNPDAENPTWTSPRRLADGAPLNKPIVTSNGDWLFPWGTSPASKINLQRFGVSPAVERTLLHDLGPRRGSQVYRSRDQGRTFDYLGQASLNATWDEHMVVERRDRSLWMLVRATYGMGQSTSQDGGRTWSPVTPFMEGPHVADKRFYIARLNSGALLMVRNNGTTASRARMTAFVSDDDGATWKGGLVIDERDSVSYPDGLQTKDGVIYVIYDHNRNPDGIILMATFREEDVRAGRAVSDKVRLRVETDRLKP